MNQNTEVTQEGREEDFIPYARPRLDSLEEQAVLQVMRSGWLTTGAKAAEFEQKFAQDADPSGGHTALALNSASAGLHLGLLAMDLPAGSRVIVSPYTFAASANSIIHAGLVPRMVDCLPGGYHLDPSAVEKILSSGKSRGGGLFRKRKKKVSALMSVHFGGWEESGDVIQALADSYRIGHIEDAAHSFPARRQDHRDLAQGTRGNCGIYSFYANKTITTGEGGMLISSDPGLIDRVKNLRLHGITREVWNRYQSKSAGYRYDISQAGFKYNLPDILAAIGVVQLKKARSLGDQRRDIARRYSRAFADRDWIVAPPGSGSLETGSESGPVADELAHSWHLYSLRLNPGKLSISRDEFMGSLKSRGIGSSVHFIPLHLMSYYRQRFGYSPGDFPHALESFEATISLPIYPGLGESSVQRIIDEVLDIGDTHYRSGLS